MERIEPAHLVSASSYTVTGKIRITEYFFTVPRLHSAPNPQPEHTRLTLFARAARRLDTSSPPVIPPVPIPAHSTSSPAVPPVPPFDPPTAKPWVLYLQGGPGFGCSSPRLNAWTQAFLDRGYQVLCLDQRGTGLSSPLTTSTLALRGDRKVQEEYVKAFRADNIVRDCEAVRLALGQLVVGAGKSGAQNGGSTNGAPPAEKIKWSLLGQSYGGFCSVTYLSMFPQGLREVFILGGLPPLTVPGPDGVYERLVKKVIQRNEAFYTKFPEDVLRVRRILDFLQRFGDTTVRDTSAEGFITAKRFMQLGLQFGFHGGFDDIHEIILRADNDLNCFGHLTRPTITAIESKLPFNDHIIYAILHEAAYCQGDEPSNWSAHRALLPYREHFDIPSPDYPDANKPVYFTGEMIFPWMFASAYASLTPLAELAESLAQYTAWTPLYDAEQLARNTVPVFAAVYVDDMYVDLELSLAAAARIRGCRTFVTNALLHDAVRSRCGEVLRGLFAVRDEGGCE